MRPCGFIKRVCADFTHVSAIITLFHLLQPENTNIKMSSFEYLFLAIVTSIVPIVINKKSFYKAIVCSNRDVDVITFSLREGVLERLLNEKDADNLAFKEFSQKN